jgi:endonuclease/exonuclease/phosphatase family metal-dependent hydrolase
MVNDIPFLSAPASIGNGLDDFVRLVGDRGPHPDSGGTNFRRGSSRRAGMMVTVNGQETSILEVQIDAPDFLPSIFLEAGAAVSRAVGRLVIRNGTDYTGTVQPNGWLGTGFLVGPGLLLTNHHVLNSPEVAQAATLQLNYRNRLDGSADKSEEFTLQPDRLFITSPVRNGFDYTFVAVDPAITEQYGFIPMNRRAYVIAPPAPGNIIQHPEGRYQEVVIHNNPILSDNGLLLHYLSDTQSGASGSPVLDNRWRLIALHHAATLNRTGLAAPGRPPSQFVNEGIKLSSIAADLEARRGTGAGHAEQVLAAFDGINSATGFFGTLGRTTEASPGLEALVDKYKGTDQDVDIGSWNIEWFSNRFRDKMDRVAAVIADFNLDIWALIESSPEAADELVATLESHYGLDFGVAHSEPGAPTSKQSTSMIWNKATVDGERLEWDDKIRTWLGVRSQNFSDDMLEAVHGKVFDRYPGLFRFRVKDTKFDFFTVPLHLKAMGEGSLRRQMASKILAAAVARMIKNGADQDWILLGDLNAEIATNDFAPLAKYGLVPLSAEDEGNQSFTYLKSPHKSMIDHVYVSPNLATRYGAQDFFVVTADKTYPDYIKEISDHRPIVTRLALGKAPEVVASDMPPELIEALRELFPGAADMEMA